MELASTSVFPDLDDPGAALTLLSRPVHAGPVLPGSEGP